MTFFLHSFLVFEQLEETFPKPAEIRNGNFLFLFIAGSGDGDYDTLLHCGEEYKEIACRYTGDYVSIEAQGFPCFTMHLSKNVGDDK